MSRISGMISFLSKLFLKLQKVRFHLLQSSWWKHLRILANLLIDKGKQLAHLKCYIEEFLIDELRRIVFAESRLDTFQVSL